MHEVSTSLKIENSGKKYWTLDEQEEEGMRVYFFFFLAVFFLADFRTNGAEDFFCTVL